MQKILIVRTCALGDFIVNLPALIALHKTEPGARFTLVGNPATLELARDFVAVDAIHSIETQPWCRLFYERLPDLDFDRAVVWMADPVVARNLRASGIPNVFRANPFPAYGHAADHLLRTLHLSRPELPDLWNADSAEIVIHPGSGSPTKNWPYFDELRKRLANSVVLRQDLSLRNLSRYLRARRAVVGNDSGITHLSAFLGCPTIAIFGPTDPRTWGPVGRRSRVIWKRRLEDISVDEIVKAVDCTSSATAAAGVDLTVK